MVGPLPGRFQLPSHQFGLFWFSRDNLQTQVGFGKYGFAFLENPREVRLHSFESLNIGVL